MWGIFLKPLRIFSPVVFLMVLFQEEKEGVLAALKTCFPPLPFSSEGSQRGLICRLKSSLALKRFFMGQKKRSAFMATAFAPVAKVQELSPVLIKKPALIVMAKGKG